MIFVVYSDHLHCNNLNPVYIYVADDAVWHNRCQSIGNLSMVCYDLPIGHVGVTLCCESEKKAQGATLLILEL